MSYVSVCVCVCVVLCCSLRKRLSVSESSHTESDSSPPLTVRRRCCSAIIEMPRFAISTEDEGASGSSSSSSGGRKTPVRGPRPEELPVERALKLDESPTTPGSTSSQQSRATLTRQSHVILCLKDHVITLYTTPSVLILSTAVLNLEQSACV